MVFTDDTLTKLNHLADELVKVAEALAQMTRHDISLVELKSLQDRQNAILEEINRLLHAIPGKLYVEGADERNGMIRDKLLRFEEANRTFIKNVKRLKGIIQLEHGSDS